MNSRTSKKERVNRLYQMHANKQNPKEFILAGDICGAVGLKDIRTGDTICDPKKPIALETMDFPDPVISIAIEPKTQEDIDKMGMALGKLTEEDPTFTVKVNEETGQTVINNTKYGVIKAITDPQLLHQDEHRRFVFVVSFEIKRRSN